MKIRFFIITACFFFICLFSSCFHYNNHGDNVSISIQESDDEYRLKASFNERDTREIQNFIRDFTEQKEIFNSQNEHIELTLDDDTKFSIRSHRGQLNIKFDKEENSSASYERIKDMYEGVKELLAEN